MGFNTSSVWLKVALVCLSVGTLIFVIGFATNSWKTADNAYNYKVRWGLWSYYNCHQDVRRVRSCSSLDITKYVLESYERHTGEDWVAFYRATQVFECLGLVCAGLALIIIFLFVFCDQMRKRSALIFIIVLCFVGVACMVIGFAVFGTQFPGYYEVGWSMGIAIAGSILIFIAGVMAVLDLKK